MLTVDASVWVAAGNPNDVFAERSRAFLTTATQRSEIFCAPSFVEVEVACALARRWQNAEEAREWAKSIMVKPGIVSMPVDAALLAFALHLGTTLLLRAGDALYVAVAASYSAPLISWDAELIRRAGAITPTDWLAANAP
jgi:predicted nucleic acid-binding protein